MQRVSKTFAIWILESAIRTLTSRANNKQSYRRLEVLHEKDLFSVILRENQRDAHTPIYSFLIVIPIKLQIRAKGGRPSGRCIRDSIDELIN